MLPNWEGAPPESPVILAVCDASDFVAHGASFIRSAFAHKIDVHIHLVNPSSRCLQGVYHLMSEGKTNFTVTREETTESGYPVKLRALNCLLAHGYPILMLDIHTVINKEFKFPESKCGFYKKDGVVNKNILFVTDVFQPHLNRLFLGCMLTTEHDKYMQGFSGDISRLHGEEDIFFGEDVMSNKPNDDTVFWLKSEHDKYVKEKRSYGLLLSQNRSGKKAI
jgi:hypothetical protein